MAPNTAKLGKRNEKKDPLDFGGLDPSMMMVSTRIFILHDDFIVLHVSPVVNEKDPTQRCNRACGTFRYHKVSLCIQ